MIGKKIKNKKINLQKIKKFILKNRTNKLISFLLTILVLIPIFFLIASLIRKPVEAAWFDNSYSFRKRIDISSHSSNENNVYVTVPTFNATDGTRFQGDCGDLRFTKYNGESLPYFVVSCGASTIVHVFFDTLPSGASSFYMYYGNSNVGDGFSYSDFSTAASGLGTVAFATEEVGPGPVAYWKMDEGQGQIVHDSTTHSYNGTLGANSSVASDDPTWTDENQCVLGKCLKFDGVDDLVTGTINASNFTNKVSLSAWVFRDTLPSIPNTIFLQAGSSVNGNGFQIYQTWYQGSYEYKFILKDSGTWTSCYVDVAIDPNLDNNLWTYITGVYDGANAYLYRNGILLGSDSCTGGNLQLANNTFIIGGQATQSTKGIIDESKIYNYARTAAQIRADYTSGSEVIGNRTKTKLKSGLVGYWKMDEASWNNDCSTQSVIDATGNGYNGKYCPSIAGSTNTVIGKFNKGGVFDGSNDYVDFGTNTNLKPTTFTFTSWVKTTSTSQQTIISDSKWGNYYGLNIRTTSNAVTFQVQSSSQTANNTTATTVIADGNWHFIAGIYDMYTNQFDVWIDSVLYPSTTTVDIVYEASAATLLGWFETGSVTHINNSWNGSMDEVRLYNRALSNPEIIALYNSAPAPVGYWTMDEPSGDALDTSSNQNPATNTSTTSVLGTYSNARYFNGTSSKMVITDSSVLDLNSPVTVSAWVKATNTTSKQHIVSRWGSVNNYQLFLNGDCSGGSAFGFSVQTSVQRYDACANGTLDTNWHFVSGTYDGSSVRIYVDGILKTTTATSGTILYSGTQNINIGTSGSADYFNGIIDDVKIYNYARTLSQIAVDRGSNPLPGYSGERLPMPSYYYKFDEQNDQYIKNSIATTNDTKGTFGVNSSTGSDDPTWKDKNNCKINGCITLDGSNDIVSFNDSTVANISGPITISLWVKTSGSNDYSGIVHKYATNNNGFELSLDTGGAVRFDIGNGTNYITSRYTQSNVEDGNWHNVIATYDGFTTKMYVDGKLGNYIISGNGYNTATTQIMKLGNDSCCGTTRFFNGSLDEVKIYNVGFSDAQARDEYNAAASMNVGVTSNSEESLLSDGAGNSPVGDWPLDEKSGTTTADKSTNSRNGTINNAVWAVGKEGAALIFGGSSSYVNVGNSSGLNPTSTMTMEAWVYLTQNQSTLASVLSRDGETTARTYSIEVGSNGTNVIRVWIGVGGSPKVVDGPALALNTWYHVVGEYDGAAVKMYLNGNLQGSTAATGTITTNTDPTIIGASSQLNSEQFTGKIDHVKIYNYARTQGQVAYDYNGGEPVARWKFDECQGNIANDSSGNGLNGTIILGASGVSAVGTCNTSSTAWGNGISGKFNSSISLDGDDKVQVQDNNILDVTDKFTISAWIYQTNVLTTNGYRIVDKNTAGVGDGYSLDTRGDASTGRKLRFCGVDCVTASTLYSLNQWHYAVATIDGLNIKLYLDGKLDGSGTQSSKIVANALPLYIGSPHVGCSGTCGITEFFKGQIDDVSIYNYVLSQSEINILYNNGGSIYYGPTSGQP